MADAWHALCRRRGSASSVSALAVLVGCGHRGVSDLAQGLCPALPVIIAAALPAGFWWAQGDVIPLASVLLVSLMAVILRERIRWSEALIVGTLAAAIMVQLGIFSPPGGTELMLEQLRELARGRPHAHGVCQPRHRYDDSGRHGHWRRHGLVVLLAAIACLALARSWQAGLYNPGGFREEFHALRLAPKELAILVVLGVAGMVLGAQALAMLSWIPLLIAGIALVHGFIGIKGMNGLWLVAFYVLLITTWPTILIVLLLGLIDTFANVRARLARSN